MTPKREGGTAGKFADSVEEKTRKAIARESLCGIQSLYVVKNDLLRDQMKEEEYEKTDT